MIQKNSNNYILNCNYIKKFSVFFIIGGMLWLVGVPGVFAGDPALYLFPESGSYAIGDEFSISVNINTDGELVNVVEGDVSFNTKDLEIVELSQEGSILDFWNIEPTYDEKKGTVTFAGGIPSGYVGDDGTVFSITFKALSNVSSRVRFLAGAAILASDGYGTNILKELNSGVYTLSSREVIPNIRSVEKITGPVYVSSHPLPEEWYAKNTARFDWENNKDTTSVRLLVDNFPESIPRIVYDPPIETKEVKDLADGIWYFHMQEQSSSGWGDIVHIPFRIDTVAPTLSLVEEYREDLSDPNVSFHITALDETSGIMRVEAVLDDGDPVLWGEKENIIFTSENIDSGEHTLTVSAFDFARNETSTTTTFSVLALEPPLLLGMSNTITVGDILVVKGSTYPDAQVVVSVKKDGADFVPTKILSDSAGNFTFVLNEKTQEGLYEIWAVATDGRGAESAPSSRVVVRAQKPGFLLWGTVVLGYLAVIVPLIALTIFLFILLLYGVRLILKKRYVIGREVAEVENVVEDSFSGIRTAAREMIDVIESAYGKRKLTLEEKQVYWRMKDVLNHAEQKIDKEVDDIRDTLEKKTMRISIKKD